MNSDISCVKLHADMYIITNLKQNVITYLWNDLRALHLAVLRDVILCVTSGAEPVGQSLLCCAHASSCMRFKTLDFQSKVYVIFLGLCTTTIKHLNSMRKRK